MVDVTSIKTGKTYTASMSDDKERINLHCFQDGEELTVSKREVIQEYKPVNQ